MPDRVHDDSYDRIGQEVDDAGLANPPSRRFHLRQNRGPAALFPT